MEQGSRLSGSNETAGHTAKLYSGKRAVSNALAAAAVNPLILLIGLVRFGILIRLLPLDTYGVFLLLSSIVMQFDYLDGGLRQSLQRYIPQFMVQDRRADVARAVTATLATMMGFGLLAGLGVALFTYVGGAGIFADNTEVPGLEGGLYLAAAALFLSWPLTTFRAAIEGFNRFNEATLSRLAAEIVRTIAVVAGALAGWEVEWLFILATLPVICQQLFLAFRAQQLLGTSIIRIDGGMRRVFREIFHYSKWMAIGQIGSTLNNSMDKLIVGAALGVGAVPIYFGLRQILSASSSLSVTFNRIVLPTASHRMSSGGVKEMHNLVLKGTRAQMSFFTPFVTLITLFATPILSIWAGQDYAAYAPALQIGLLLFLFNAAPKVLARAAAAIDEQIRFLTLFNLSVAAASSVLIYVLGTNFGVSGAFLAIPISAMLVNPVWYTRILRAVGIPFRTYVLDGILAGAWPALAVLALSVPLLPWISGLADIPTVAAVGLVWAAITFLASFMFGLSREHRRRLWEAVLSAFASLTRKGLEPR